MTAAAGITLAAAFGLWIWRASVRSGRELSRTRAELAALQALAASAPAACWHWPDGHENPTLAAGRGVAVPGEYRKFLELLAPDDAEALTRAIAELRGGGREFSLEAGYADGSARFDITGRQVSFDVQAQGVLVQGVLVQGCAIWVSDAGARMAALAERDRIQTDSDRLRRALDALPLPVWCRGQDLRLTDCNRAYAAAVDTEVPAAVGLSRELMAGLQGEAGPALARAALSGRAPRSESHHIVIGGSRRLIAVTEMPDPLSGGLIGFAQDFTEVENVQSELARHIAAHADVLENIAAAIAIYGPDTRLKFFNTAFAVLWRLEEEWLGGEPGLDEVLEKLRERRQLPEYADFSIFRKSQLSMFTSLIHPEEELLHLPDERTLRVVVSTHPFGGLTFVYEDVTDRLVLERSYNTLIEVQRETLDNLYEGIAVFGSDGRLKLFNPAYARIWHLAPADLAGEPHVAEIVEKSRAFFDDGSHWPERKQRIVARVTAPVASTGQLERRDGSVLEIASVPLPDGNVLLSYLDVTDTARVQRALRERAEALETAGRLKSEFIANVSYELRTPLNAIIGFAEILTNQYFGELSPRQLDYSRGVLDSSHRLLSLINDILDLATIEAGYMVLETAPVDVGNLMASVLALTAERARKQQLTIESDCAPDVGIMTADERRLKQALFNLVSNAIKFTPAGGTIRLKARRDGDAVTLKVEDTGIGIPNEHQTRVFEKFERSDPQAPQSGAGLGLSLVKSLIELHGGHVEMVSSPESGTAVTLHLPGNTG